LSYSQLNNQETEIYRKNYTFPLMLYVINLAY